MKTKHGPKPTGPPRPTEGERPRSWLRRHALRIPLLVILGLTAAALNLRLGWPFGAPISVLFVLTAVAPWTWMRHLELILWDAGRLLLWYVPSAVMLAWVFPPGGFWPLAFVCLTPWVVATCRAQRAWLAHWLSFFTGWGFFLVCLRWLLPVTGLGYIALAFYLGIYWTLAGWAIRTARRHGISPLWSLPVVWVACEFLRATVMTGFPWFFVAHGLYERLPLIQIADLAGAYGVSFLALFINGVLAELILQRWPRPATAGHTVPARTAVWQVYAGVAAALVLVAATLAYGRYRMKEMDFANRPELAGPRVAVIQEDFPLTSAPPYGESPFVVLASYLELGARAAQERPDLLVFPETVWGAVQNREFVEIEQAAVDDEHADTWLYGNICHLALSAFARGDYPAVNVQISQLERYLPDRKLPRLPSAGGPAVTVVVGSMAIVPTRDVYPWVRKYNSALIYDPDGTQRLERYDKCHLVPFGEFVPFRYGRLHWLYRWLNSLSPFSQGGVVEYSLTPGDALRDFELRVGPHTYSFGIPICYEDTTPYVIRDFVWGGGQRRADFLLNISNDGWFQHSAELPQHLAICVFRAVENRVTIARAVNTGISGFVDPNGRIYARVVDEQGRSFVPKTGGVVGYAIAPVYLDARASFYGRWGDWLAGICVALTIVLWLGGVFERWVLALKHRIELALRKS